jgi:hypothetical protein
VGDSGIGLAATSISESSTGTPAAWPSPTRPQDCAKSCQTVPPIPYADGHTPGATALGLLSPSHLLAHFAAVSLI